MSRVPQLRRVHRGCVGVAHRIEPRCPHFVTCGAAPAHLDVDRHILAKRACSEEPASNATSPRPLLRRWHHPALPPQLPVSLRRVEKKTRPGGFRERDPRFVADSRLLPADRGRRFAVEALSALVAGRTAPRPPDHFIAAETWLWSPPPQPLRRRPGRSLAFASAGFGCSGSPGRIRSTRWAAVRRGRCGCAGTRAGVPDAGCQVNAGSTEYDRVHLELLEPQPDDACWPCLRLGNFPSAGALAREVWA